MKNNMRIQLVPNLKLEQKQKYNSTQEKYLKILSSSYEELHQYILDKASTNPLIEYNSSNFSVLNPYSRQAVAASTA